MSIGNPSLNRRPLVLFLSLLLWGVLGIQVGAETADSQIISVWLERALAAAKKIESPAARSYAHYQLAGALSRHGIAEEALKSAQQITNTQQQLYALTNVAEAARKVGNVELCRAIVAAGRPGAIQNAGPFITSAFLDVCFAAGMLDAALEFIDETYKPASRPSAYGAIVSEYCARGDREAAERFIMAKNLGESGKLAMAHGFVRANEVPSALEIIESLSNSDLADAGYVTVGTALAHAGDDQAAKKYVGRVKNEANRRNTAGEIARFYNKDDSLDELRPKFAATNSREEKSGMLPIFVQKLVEASAFDEADRAIENTAKTISEDPQPDATSKFGTYGDKSALAWIRGQHLTIATGMIEKGRFDEATGQLSKAIATIGNLSPESAIVKWPLEVALVNVLLKLDREDEAIKIMEESTGPTTRDAAAAAIAIYRINQGKVDEALSLIKVGGDRSSHGAEKGDVAVALLLTGHDERAIEFLNSLDDSETNASAFAQCARNLTEAGELEQLANLYGKLDSPVARAHLATEAANRLLWLKQPQLP